MDANPLNQWFEWAKAFKHSWVEATQRGDMPPTVIAERNGQPLIIVVAPQIDKMLGLHAADMCRGGMCADAVTLICDAHMATGQTEADLEKWKHQRMQDACDEEGACSTGEITDCIQAIRMDTSLKAELHCLPYDYHGKDGGVDFKWKPDMEVKINEKTEDKAGVTGFIPESLREIMQRPTILENDQLQQAAAAMGLTNVDKQVYHAGMAMRRLMIEQDFILFEVFEITPDTLKPNSPIFKDQILKKMADLKRVYEQASRKPAESTH